MRRRYPYSLYRRAEHRADYITRYRRVSLLSEGAETMPESIGIISKNMQYGAWA